MPLRSAETSCAVKGCGKPAKNRGWCWGHYNRWRRNGDPLALRGHKGPAPRFQTGDRVGRLTVIDRQLVIREDRQTHRSVYTCRCDCGAETQVQNENLGRNTFSCGCFARDRRAELAGTPGRIHGMCGTRTWNSWSAMRQRCSNPKTNGYKNYGGRGITVCERWDSFENFYADMGDRPERMTLDRIDPDGNYEPGNCRWATYKQQSLNVRKRKA